uniref:KIF-binding protein n=1 Tax=Cacopsylla melanoneura TaxID=428564 RepID=A0A8D8UF59_9HEMI
MTDDNIDDLASLFQQIETLLLIEAPKDPPSDPYRSKYKAKDLLEQLKVCLTLFKSESAVKDALLAHTWLQLGIISVDTDEVQQGEDAFNTSLDIIKSKELTPECIVTCVSAYNNLGLVWSQRTEWERAFDFFGKAEKHYKDFVASQLEPVDPATLFTAKIPEGKVLSLEKLYTLTLYYLAQCYIHQGDSIQSAVCCHTTLRRQLEIKDYHPSEWSLNMATLSQVCLENNAFHLARECLSIASKVHADYESELNEMETKDEAKYQTEHDKWLSVGADIDRCWAKYGLILLTVSKERLMAEDSPEHMKPFEIPDKLKSLSIGFTVDTSSITADYILTYSDAIKLFNTCHAHLQHARAYFSLSEHATDHARVVQEISRLYQELVFFVESEAEQCKFHKRRITELESLVKQFNKQFYITICREIWYELGEIYSDMYDLKHDILRKTNQPTQHQVAKINWLIKNSLTYYIELIQSFKDARTNEYPGKYSDEWEKPLLLAFFYSARLLTKLITNDKLQLKKNQLEALDNYKYIIEYCTKNKEAGEKFATELSLCQEMVTLLPMKIQKISAQITS